MSNMIFCENLETRFFYCWIQLPAVDVRLVFWLAISPIGGQVVAATWSSSCALETQPLHEVPREAASDSELYPLCDLQSSCWSLFPLSLATSLLPALAPTTSRYFIGIALECHHEWPHQGPLHFGHDDQVMCNLIGILPLNFRTRHRSVSNFWTAVCSWTMGLVRVAPDCRCTRQTNKQENSRLESRTIVQVCSCYDCCRPRC